MTKVRASLHKLLFLSKQGFLMLLVPLMVAVLASCENAPINKLVNPTIANTTGNWESGEWVIYDDEIKTGGSVMMYTTMEGQVLDFNWTNGQYKGSKCIKYSWDGGDVTAYANPGVLQHGFVGFSLIVASAVENYSSVAKNLTPGGYTKISFWVKGSLSSGVALVVKGNNATADVWTSNDTNHKITGDWQRYEFPIDTSSLAVTRDFVRFVLTFDNASVARGNGGTVYLDDVRLER